MNKDSFFAEYKKSVDNFSLPENLEADIIKNLRSMSEDKEYKESKSSDLRHKKTEKSSHRRYVWSLIAAMLAVVIGVTSIVSAISLMSKGRTVTFRVRNAVNAASVSGVRVVFRDDSGELIRDSDGEPVTAVSDKDGVVSVQIPGSTELTAELDIEGFIPISTSADNENVYISPVMDENTYRAVLCWDEDCDLDAYLTVTRGELTERLYYFESDIKNESGEVIAALDIDSETPHAPETVTFNTGGDTVFRFSVASYSALKESRDIIPKGARVALYRGQECVDVYELDTQKDGNVWCVFEITGDKIKVRNDVYTVGAMTEIR